MSTHPLDQELEDSGMLSWILPSLSLLLSHLRTLLPYALGFGAYLWILPHILWSSSSSSQLADIFDQLQMTLVSVTLLALAYIALARAEGSDYGLGAIPPLRGIAIRLGLVTLIWAVTFAVVGWLLGKVFAALATTPMFLSLAVKLFGLMGWWSIPFVIWVISPIGALFGTAHALSQIRAIRAEEGVIDLVLDSLRTVFTQPRRIILPCYIIAGVLLLVGFGAFQLLAKAIAPLIQQLGTASLFVLGVGIVAATVPYWFVLERAWLPQLGIEDEDAAEAESAAPAPPPVDPAQELAQVQTEQGPEAAARRLVNGIRQRRVQAGEFARLAAIISEPAQLAQELSALAAEWQDNPRPGELAWVVQEGMNRSPQFLMDRPGNVLAISKRLTVLERIDLAQRLLLSFLKLHRSHPDHLPAGMQLARLLAMHAGNAEGARKLLEQLKTLYSNDPQPAQLLKQLQSY
ncbi:MAG: hypothetical protein U1F26_01225 [Lysobacterales bacterium]